MKHIILLSISMLASIYCYSQSEEEAKDFIKQQIETHPTSSSYKQYVKFAADDELNDFDLLSSGFLPSDLLHVIVFYEKLSTSTTGDVYLKTYAFDIREIKNIVVSSKENYTELRIYFRNQANAFYTKSAPNKKKELAHLESAVIYLSQDQKLGDRIVKSFYFLCKKYGGQPNESSAF